MHQWCAGRRQLAAAVQADGKHCRAQPRSVLGFSDAAARHPRRGAAAARVVVPAYVLPPRARS